MMMIMMTAQRRKGFPCRIQAYLRSSSAALLFPVHRVTADHNDNDNGNINTNNNDDDNYND